MIDFVAAIFAIGVVAVTLFLMHFGGYFSYWVIRKFFWKDKTMMIVPSFISFTCGLFFFLDTLLLTVSLTYSLIFTPYDSHYDNIKKSLPIIIIIVVICFCETFLSFTIFEKERIVFRNILHISGKKYSYNDIIRVEVLIKKVSRMDNRLKYLIIMKDGRKIDLNVLKLHDGAIGDKNLDISFKNILYIESMIKANITHTITKEAYKLIDNSLIDLTDDFYNKFRGNITNS